MGARLVGGLLCDYSVARQELMAMDGALASAQHARRPATVVLTIDTADELQRAQLAKLIPHLNRLK